MKKKTKKVSNSKREIVIRVETPTSVVSEKEIAEPIQEGSKYMIPKSWVSEKQVIRLVQKTPPQYILKRKAKGGGMWDYVEGGYVKKVLNYAFGWNWDFKIIKQETFGLEAGWGQVITLGELTVKDDKGHTITKSDNGRADIKYKRETKVPMDLGNDYKASATDCLKRCASQLGIASDVYGKHEFKENNVQVVAPTTQAETPKIEAGEALKLKDGQVVGPDGKPTFLCQECASPISDKVADFSLKVFKKRLCLSCQKLKK